MILGCLSDCMIRDSKLVDLILDLWIFFIKIEVIVYDTLTASYSSLIVSKT